MSISLIHLSSSSFFAAPCSISHKILWKHPYRNALHLNGFHLIFFHLCQSKQSAALGTIFPFPFFVSIFFYEIHYINISKCLRIQIVWLNVGNYFALGLRIQLFRYTHAERERGREDSPAREINKASSIRMRVDLCWWKMKKEIVFTKRSLLSAVFVNKWKFFFWCVGSVVHVMQATVLNKCTQCTLVRSKTGISFMCSFRKKQTHFYFYS